MVTGAVPKKRPSRKTFTSSLAGALTLTRPRSGADEGPKWTRPKVSAGGGTSLGSPLAADSVDSVAAAGASSTTFFLAKAGAAASREAAQIKRDTNRRRD